MVKSFWNIVNKVIQESDILLLLLDARMIEDTRNKEIEDKIKFNKKPLIYVITKSDLVDKRNLNKHDCSPSVIISAKNHYGTTLLRTRILIEASKIKIDKKMVRVGVLGYPNVGKSSLINAMKGKHSAPTSNTSGFTKGVQKIKSDNKIMFLDTPGVIPYLEKDSIKHARIGTVDFNKEKDPEMVIIKLMDEFPGKIEQFFDVKINKDGFKTIENIALKKNLLKKGGVADLDRAARLILKNWQKGIILV